MRRHTTFERDFIATSLRLSATKRGGNANPWENGCRYFPQITLDFAGCSNRWIGSMINDQPRCLRASHSQCFKFGILQIQYLINTALHQYQAAVAANPF